MGVCAWGGGAEVEPRGLRLSRVPPVPPVPPAPHRVVCVEATERLCGSHRGPAPILWGHKSNHHFSADIKATTKTPKNGPNPTFAIRLLSI